jgi:hypothetical protein
MVSPDTVTATLGVFIEKAKGFPVHGRFWLPPSEMATWRAAAVAMAPRRWCLYQMATVRDDDSMAALVDYATRHMAEKIADIDRELHGGVKEDGTKVDALTRNSTIRERRMALTAMKMQAERYEKILGKSFERIKQAADAAATAKGAAAILEGLI